MKKIIFIASILALLVKDTPIHASEDLQDQGQRQQTIFSDFPQDTWHEVMDYVTEGNLNPFKILTISLVCNEFYQRTLSLRMFDELKILCFFNFEECSGNIEQSGCNEIKQAGYWPEGITEKSKMMRIPGVRMEAFAKSMFILEPYQKKAQALMTRTLRPCLQMGFSIPQCIEIVSQGFKSLIDWEFVWWSNHPDVVTANPEVVDTRPRLNQIWHAVHDVAALQEIPNLPPLVSCGLQKWVVGNQHAAEQTEICQNWTTILLGMENFEDVYQLWNRFSENLNLAKQAELSKCMAAHVGAFMSQDHSLYMRHTVPSMYYLMTKDFSKACFVDTTEGTRPVEFGKDVYSFGLWVSYMNSLSVPIEVVDDPEQRLEWFKQQNYQHKDPQ